MSQEQQEKASSNTSTTVASIELDNNEFKTVSYKAQPFSVYDGNQESIIDCNAFATIYKNQTRVKIPYGCINYGI